MYKINILSFTLVSDYDASELGKTVSDFTQVLYMIAADFINI